MNKEDYIKILINHLSISTCFDENLAKIHTEKFKRWSLEELINTCNRLNLL